MGKPVITSRFDAPGQITAKLSSGSHCTLRWSCWPLSTAFKNSESDVGGRDRRIFFSPLSPSRAQDIYFEDIYVGDITDVPAIEAAEFARKSTMQNYCPLTSLPILEFECVDEESYLPHWRATLCSFICGFTTLVKCFYESNLIIATFPLALLKLFQFYSSIFMININKIK